MPQLPIEAPQLSAYHFSQLPASQITTTALSPYDTAILYGIRWSDISTSGQAAINAFALTHKVVIWDADDTGSQNYSTFIHPFSEVASGENYPGKPNNSVVSFPTGLNFLASDKPNSPYYLDPNQFVTAPNEIKDMNAMVSGTKNWFPALIAANAKLRNGGWVLAWSYGVIGDHTGLTIYSGIDADTFRDTQLNPNNAVTELKLQLQAPFQETPNTSCAPECQPPPNSGGGPPTHAACSFAKRVPNHWSHRRVPIWLKTSVAAGITGRVLSPKGHILASAKEKRGNLLHFNVPTRRLRTNHVSRLKALVYFNGQQACSKRFRLKVDNTPPRLLSLRTTTLGGIHLASFRASEKSQMRIVGGGPKYAHWVLIASHRLINARLRGNVRRARLILRDRAGNKLVRKLIW